MLKSMTDRKLVPLTIGKGSNAELESRERPSIQFYHAVLYQQKDFCGKESHVKNL